MQLDSSGGKSPRPVINVTPLVDVVLVLLIIFMVVIPNMQENKTIELFRTVHADEDREEEKEALVVTLAEDGTAYVAKQPFTRQALLDELRRTHEVDPSRRILLRADTRLTYGQIRSFLYEAKEVGFDRVKLAVGAVRDGAELTMSAGVEGEG